MEQESARARLVVIERSIGGLIRRDGPIDKPCLTSADERISAREIDSPCFDRFDLKTKKRDARLVGRENLIIKMRAPIDSKVSHMILSR